MSRSELGYIVPYDIYDTTGAGAKWIRAHLTALDELGFRISLLILSRQEPNWEAWRGPIKETHWVRRKPDSVPAIVGSIKGMPPFAAGISQEDLGIVREWLDAGKRIVAEHSHMALLIEELFDVDTNELIVAMHNIEYQYYDLEWSERGWRDSQKWYAYLMRRYLRRKELSLWSDTKCRSWFLSNSDRQAVIDRIKRDRQCGEGGEGIAQTSRVGPQIVSLGALYDWWDDLEFITNTRADRRVNGRILYVGRLDSMRNLKDLRWLIGEVLPAVRDQFRQMKCRVVGIGKTEKIERLVERANVGNAVEVVGYVQNIADEYLKADCVVIPWRHPTGMPTKLVESARYLVPVVGTPNVSEVVSSPSGVVVGRSGKGLANQIVSVLVDSKLRESLRAKWTHKLRGEWSRERTLEKLNDVVSI